jgi:hypothetical protein
MKLRGGCLLLLLLLCGTCLCSVGELRRDGNVSFSYPAVHTDYAVSSMRCHVTALDVPSVQCRSPLRHCCWYGQQLHSSIWALNTSITCSASMVVNVLDEAGLYGLVACCASFKIKVYP